MLAYAKNYLADIFNLFYPAICVSCTQALNNAEQVICYKCQNELPETNFHTDTHNALQKRLWGRIDIQGATALYHFNKGSGVQELLHHLKYKKRTDVGVYLGNLLGQRLLEPNSIIKQVDVIVPVPLHPKKEKERGYNQCDFIAEGLALAMQLPVLTTAVERTEKNVSQTGKNRFERYANVANIFSVKDAGQLAGKHILLVDDVVTTGATAESCMQAILKVPEVKVSFVALAHADI